MEKRRRARINASLGELKALLQEAIKKEGARHNKMEKADILEMAVKHLRQIQRQHVNMDSFSDQMPINKYMLGFNACAEEVSKYLDGDVDLKARLLNHLANCITGTSSQNTSCSTPLSIKETPCTATSSTPISPISFGTISPTSTTMSPEIQRSETKTAFSTTMNNLNGVEQKVQNFGVPQVLDILVSNVSNKLNDGFASKLETSPSLNNSFSTASENSFPVLVNSSHVSYNRLGIADINNNGKSGHDNTDNISMSEVNNNTIVFPTMVGIKGTATIPLHQQQLQQLQIQPMQQVQHLSDISLDQNHQAVLQDSSILSNRLQFIPMKIANGETALVLSAANFVSPSQISGYSFPFYAPQSQPQIFTQPLQIAQIAVAIPQEEHQQTMTYIPQVSQTQSTVLSPIFDGTQSKPPFTLLDSHSAPLNLTSSSQKSPEKQCSLISTPVSTMSSYAARTHDILTSSQRSGSIPEVSAAAPQVDQQAVSHNECTSTTITPIPRPSKDTSPTSVDLVSHSKVTRGYTSFSAFPPSEHHSSAPLPIPKAFQIRANNWTFGSPDQQQDLRLEFRPNIDTLPDKKPDYFRPW